MLTGRKISTHSINTDIANFLVEVLALHQVSTRNSLRDIITKGNRKGILGVIWGKNALYNPFWKIREFVSPNWVGTCAGRRILDLDSDRIWAFFSDRIDTACRIRSQSERPLAVLNVFILPLVYSRIRSRYCPGIWTPSPARAASPTFIVCAEFHMAWLAHVQKQCLSYASYY